MNRFTIPKFSLAILLFMVFTISYSQEIAINEVMSSNTTTLADEDGSFEDWIELYNYGTTPVNLDGYGLTDTPAQPYKWVFPQVTLSPGQYLLIWASDKNRVIPGQPLHANFKISTGGEAIVLTRPDGTIADQAPATALEGDVSIARQPDGTGTWQFFYTATPGMPNTGFGLPELLTPPVFSHNSGLYTQPFDLTLSHSNQTAVIVYTLDGSEPQLSNTMGSVFLYKNVYALEPNDTPGPLLTDTYTSNAYTAPINIYDRSTEPDQLTVKNTRQDALYTPPVPVRKATVVKARVFINGIGSKTISKTFFVWAGGNPYQIPVVSLQIQENYLFDYNDGVYTAGADYDTWRANNPLNNQWWRPDWCNYWRSGEQWEYPVNIEFFEPGTLNSAMSINGGFRIHGNNSRTLAIKSLRLYARSDYDDTDVFEHNFFDEKIYGSTVPDNNEYKRLMLRGDGTGGAIAYDVVFKRIMQPVYGGVGRIKPAIHFINGEYWGLTALRDRLDKHHYALNFNLDSDNIVQVDCKGNNCEIDEGDNNDYLGFISMRDFIIQNDMADNALYEQAAAQLDMESFIDHMVLEVYAANDSYERQFWKVRQPEGQPHGDGKWRVTVQDFEASLKTNINWLNHWATQNSSPNESLLKHLLANATFKTLFINRFADILNTAFISQCFNNVVNQVFDEVAPYLPENTNRFPRLNFYQNSEKQNLLNWGTNRPAIQRDQIRTQFSISANLNVTLNVSDTEAGIVKMNTITIEPSTPGVSENPYPWTGIYFNGIPVTVEAIAKPGYVFTHWTGDATGNNPVITVTPTANIQLQANFEPIAVPAQQTVYFWLMDGTIQNDTPLQNINATYASNGLTATLTYNSCLDGYPFTNGHASWRKASMERRNAPTPVNYRPEANNNIAYSAGIMRGIQIKQPFKAGTLENSIELQFPTTDLKNIKLSLATESDGAAQLLLAEYWDGNQWSTTGLNNSSTDITASYELKEFDFSSVAMANNNSGFKIRLRFDGADMFIDEGKRVHFNNISVEGESTLSGIKHDADIALKVFPNPAESNIDIIAPTEMNEITLYTIYGQSVGKYAPKSSSYKIDLSQLSSGIYLLKVNTDRGEKTSKIIKK